MCLIVALNDRIVVIEGPLKGIEGSIIKVDRRKQRAKICGYEYQGSDLPADFECPICGHPVEVFEPIYE